MLLTLLAVHATAFAALLVLSRHDVVLVEEAEPWVALSIPTAAPERFYTQPDEARLPL
jgi:hypothetical protein